jgi:hypothetical protein
MPLLTPQVEFPDLTTWSLPMASAQRAGHMVHPFVLPLSTDLPAPAGGPATHAGHVAHGPASQLPTVGALALAVHRAASLAVMAAVAWLVSRKPGLALLRSAWVTWGWLWAGALAVTGLAVPIAWRARGLAASAAQAARHVVTAE